VVVAMTLTYSAYLKLDELLALQQPLSRPVEHDEMLFIIIHQVHELWFKLLLHELEKLQIDFRQGDLYDSIATCKRARTIMKTLVGQVDILETLTPLSFNSFRARLETSSGFQSVQFRELEFLLGYKRPELLKYQEGNEAGQERLRQRLEAPSLVYAFYDFVERHGVSVPPGLRERDVTQATQPDEVLQAGLLYLYKNRRDLQILFELMTDFDEGFQEWRYRHIKLVERTIGSKRGTGGSLGVEFLKRSLFQPVFPDLWAIRHQF
jgi:tryptophan 2,3-dioxygenase